jgi:quercetin dioxygenase-like cupin family protein
MSVEDSKHVHLSDWIEFADHGTVSKTLLDTSHAKVTLFCMAAGQELTEHTAGKPAIVHFTAGDGEFVLEGTSHPITPGTWFYMPSGARHALRVKTDTVFLLTFLRG